MKKLVSILLLSLLVFTNFIYTDTDESIADFLVTRTFSKNNLEYDDINPDNNTSEIIYTITPNKIKEDEMSDSIKTREIIFVIDSSASTSERDVILSGTNIKGKRIDVIKRVAKKFIKKAYESDNIKMSLVYFNQKAEVLNQLEKISGNYNLYKNIESDIDWLLPFGGTNYGDAFRRAYFELLRSGNEKTRFRHVVFLTDGEPDLFSYSNGLNFFSYVTDDSEPRWYQTVNLYHARAYAKMMGKKTDSVAKNHMIALHPDYESLANSHQVYKSYLKIANAVNSDFMLCTKEDELEIKMDEIFSDIVKKLVITNITLDDIIPEGLEIVEMPEGMIADGNHITMDIDSIEYKKSGAYYVADPVEVRVKVRATRPDNFEFKKYDGYLNYNDFNFDPLVSYIDSSVLSINNNYIKNLEASRPVNDDGMKLNEVDLNWEEYPDAVGYNIYKIVNGEKVFIKAVEGDVLSYKEKIRAEDKNETTYIVQAILEGGKFSNETPVVVDTNPSILNLKIIRENNSFIVSFDKIEGATGYSVTPEIKDVLGVVDSDSSHFKIEDNRVIYRYDLASADIYEYGDNIRFLVDGVKPNCDVYEAYTPFYNLVGLIKTKLDMNNNFYYAQARDYTIYNITDDDLIDRFDIYDPVFVVDLELTEINNNTKLEFSYPICKVYEGTYSGGDLVGEKLLKTTVTMNSDNDRLYIKLDDYENDKLSDGKDFKIILNFSIGYESENGFLKKDVFKKLREKYPDLEIYNIPYIFRQLIDSFYMKDIDELVKLRASAMYNKSIKEDKVIYERDEVSGNKFEYIKIKNKIKIGEEF